MHAVTGAANAIGKAELTARGVVGWGPDATTADKIRMLDERTRSLDREVGELQSSLKQTATDIRNEVSATAEDLPTASFAGPERVRLTRSEHAAGWLFVLPAALLIIGFGLIPIGWALLLSFQSSDFVSPPKWVGLANYRALASDPDFHAAIVRTLVYTAIFVPVTVLGGLAVAAVLNAKVRFISI